MESSFSHIVQDWDSLDESTRGYWSARLEMVTPPPLLLELSSQRLTLEDFDPRKLAEKVMHDPVLGGKLLGIANSARFGLTKPLTSIQRAIVHLGFNLVKSVMVSYMMENTFAKALPVPRSHLEYVRNWSASASIIAYHWAQAADLPDLHRYHGCQD